MAAGAGLAWPGCLTGGGTAHGNTYDTICQETGTGGQKNLAYRLYNDLTWQSSTFLENRYHALAFTEIVNVIT